jgi:hypothetical protein
MAMQADSSSSSWRAALWPERRERRFSSAMMVYSSAMLASCGAMFSTAWTKCSGLTASAAAGRG